MASAREWIMDRTGYREYLSTLLAGQPRCYQRATSSSGFDDQRAETNAADQAVALWKQLPARLHAEWKFADQGAVARDEMRQFAIGGRIDPVDAMPQKRNSRRASVQGTAMSGRIDALRQAADNAESAGSQVTGKLVRIAGAGLGWLRLPTIASAGRCSTSGLPLTYSVFGGPGIWSSSSG